MRLVIVVNGMMLRSADISQEVAEDRKQKLFHQVVYKNQIHSFVSSHGIIYIPIDRIDYFYIGE